MARPRGPKNSNLAHRARAYEMYAAGLKKTEIARELGLTPPAIGKWAKLDQWDERLAAMVERADRATELVVGDIVAETLAKLKTGMARRIAELETLCGASNHPSTRIKAIQLWLKMAGVDRALPDPVAPKTPRSLALIEDILDDEGEGKLNVG